MKEINFVHTADLHIGSRCSYLGTLDRRRQSEVMVSLRRIVNYCKSENIPLLLIAGDLFDSNSVDSFFTDEVFTIFEESEDIRIIFAAGNHDPLTADSPFLNRELPKNLTVLDVEDSCVTFDDLGVRIFGRSFGSVYEDKITGFSLKPENDDYINLMVLHGDSENTSGAYRAIPSTFIGESGMDYIALGHIHTASPLEKIGNTYYAYSGCPDGQGFDEAGEKGFYRVTIKNKKATSVFVPSCSRQHIVCDCDITGATSNSAIGVLILNFLKANYGENFADNIYKITLKGTIPSDLTVNLGEIAAQVCSNVFFAKLKNKVKHQVYLEELAKEQTLRGIFVKKMLERIEKSDASQKAMLENALELTLDAFEGEVNCLED